MKFIYDVYFDYKFDNREFDSGKEQFTESMTLYGARLTPSVGLQVKQNANVRHKLMAGIDVMKDFGRHPSAVAASPECDRGWRTRVSSGKLPCTMALTRNLGRGT